ncbi:MAG TPA: energy transducer TonB [Bacteroidia bacterium]|nr:energy transducer TonB [Bacteroidia bacterium]HNS11345.1 energy transducer TonB [Bacteroidia bacterium]
MKKSGGRKPESFIKQPNFPGGNKALDQFIKSNLRYPEAALENKIEGTVSVNLDIDVFGDVIDAKVKHKIGYGCDEEAIRIVKLLKFEKKRYMGMRVVFHRTLNIHFRLTTASRLPEKSETIKYNYTTKPQVKSGPSDRPAKDKGGETYNISINLE